MVIKDTEFVDIPTPSGPMRAHIFRPAAAGKYPGIVFYSEIFQITPPIRRAAAMLAGHGYVVAAPEIYHELEPAGFEAVSRTTVGSGMESTLLIHAVRLEIRVQYAS